MRFSVVIATKNRAKILKDCLSSLTKQKLCPDEIIVVDNGSVDNTKKVVFQFKEKLPLVYAYESQPGAPSARNRGASKATGEVIIFSDDDCLFHREWFAGIKKDFETKKISALQGKSFNALKDNPYAVASYLFDQVRVEVPLSLARRYMRKKAGLNVIFSLDTKNFAIKRKNFEKLGGFDPQFIASDDDVDLAVRLRLASIPIVFEPKAIVYHKARTNFRSFIRNRFNRGKFGCLVQSKWRQIVERENEIVRLFSDNKKAKKYFELFRNRKKRRAELERRVLSGRSFSFRLQVRLLFLIAYLVYYYGIFVTSLRLKLGKSYIQTDFSTGSTSPLTTS